MKSTTLFFILIYLFFGCASSSSSSSEIEEITFPEDLPIIKRTEWGWEKPEKFISTHQISKITLHHGGEYFADTTDVVAYLQRFQQWCRKEKNWMDNPYHFMIDFQGNIYETRPINFPGDTNTDYDPESHALICVLGNYEEQKINELQLDAVVSLSSFLARYYKVDSNDIRGHKDYAETQCPGMNFYQYLESGELIKRIEEKL